LLYILDDAREVRLSEAFLLQLLEFVLDRFGNMLLTIFKFSHPLGDFFLLALLGFHS